MNGSRSTGWCSSALVRFGAMASGRKRNRPYRIPALSPPLAQLLDSPVTV